MEKRNGRRDKGKEGEKDGGIKKGKTTLTREREGEKGF